MKITLDILKKNKAPTELLDYFTTTYAGVEIDMHELIYQAHKSISRWLYKTFKSSGLSEDSYKNGEVEYRWNRINKGTGYGWNFEDGKLHEFCEDVLNYFATIFKENQGLGASDYPTIIFKPNTEVGVHELIAQVHKDKKNFSPWLYETFKLSGACKCFHVNGEIEYHYNYKDGELHGLYEISSEKGAIKYVCEYKDGVLIEEILS